MPLAVARRDPHLLHHLLQREVRELFGNFRIVKRYEFKTMSTIQPSKDSDLTTAKVALSVEEHDVFFLRVCAHNGFQVGPNGKASN